MYQGMGDVSTACLALVDCLQWDPCPCTHPCCSLWGQNIAAMRLCWMSGLSALQNTPNVMYHVEVGLNRELELCQDIPGSVLL